MPAQCESAAKSAERERGRHVGRRVAVMAIAFSLILPHAIPSQEKLDAGRAEEFLRRECGLWQIDGGNVWIVEAERRVREHLAGVGMQRVAIVGLQNRLDERIEQNRQQWQAGLVQLESLRRAREAAKNDEAKRKPLDRQIAELQRRLIPPDSLGGTADVQTLAIELTNQRLALGVALLELRRLVPGISAEYLPLARNPRVAEALKAIGPMQRLGPMDADYVRAARALREEERLAFDTAAPIYLQGDKVRVGGILNERLPVAFTWLASQEPTLLPQSMLQAAGIDVPPDAPALRITVGEQRDVAVRRIVVPALRLAGATVRDLEVYALHPDHEDLGAQIGAAAFEGQQVSLDRVRLRLTIRK